MSVHAARHTSHDHEYTLYLAHECLKSSLAFFKPAMAAASRLPARADGPNVGLRPPLQASALRPPSADGELRGALAFGYSTELPAPEAARQSLCRGG